MSTAAVLKQITEAMPAEPAVMTGKRRRQQKKQGTALPATHEQLVSDVVKAHAATKSAADSSIRRGTFAPPKPSKLAKAVLEKLLKRQRR